MKYDSFKTPDPLFHGTDFWMLNGDLTDEQIEFQMKEMHDKGVYTFIARTYLGLRSDYPGPRFKKSLKKIIETAKVLGMKLFLQAGYMPEAVPNLPEEGALRYIYPVREGEEEGRRILCKKNGISFVEQSSHTFLDMFDPTSMEHYLKTCYEDMWKEFSEEYGKTILSIWVDEPSYNGAYLPFTGKLEALFSERWGYSFADKAWMLYFDGEGAKSLRYHYRVLMRDLLEVNYFAKVRDWCRAHNLLFSGHLMMEETLQEQIMRAQAVMPYYRYFDIPGIDVLRARMPFAEDPIADPNPTERDYNLYNTALQCTSAARQAGKKHILAEMYGVSGEGFSFRHMTAMFDTYAAMGINHRCVHGIFYTLHGRGKRAYPPHIGYYQPYWPMYGQITQYCARVSAFISEGEATAEIALLHPLETGYMLFRGSDKGLESENGGETIKSYDGKFYEMLKTLKSAHTEFDLCDLASVRSIGTAENGTLKVGCAKYKTVILPNLRVITEDCLIKLEKISAEGGRILCLGNAPCYLDGYPSEDAKRRVEAISERAESTAALIRLLGEGDIRVRGIGAEGLLIHRRRTEDGQKLLICNTDYRKRAIFTISLEDGGIPYRYDAYRAVIEKLPYEISGGRISLLLSLDPAESILLSVEKETRTDAVYGLNRGAPHNVSPLGGKWLATPETENTLLLEYCRYKKEDGAFSAPIPIVALQRLLTIENYHGSLTLRYDLQIKDDISDVFLALEDPKEQRILLDGKEISNEDLGYFYDKTFRRIFLGTLTAGRHALEIQRYFEPLSRVKNALTQLFEARSGVELEPMYLLGRFTVSGQATASRNGAIALENDFVLENAAPSFETEGETAGEGYPFFAGRMLLSKHVTISQKRKNAYFSLGVLNAACAELMINGNTVGLISRAPAYLPIGDALAEGENEICLRLYSTLFPIIGPHHRPLGNVGNTFGGGYKNPDAAWLSVDTEAEGWQTRMEDFYPTWTDQYNVTPLGIADAALLFPTE